ncbi:ESCRT-III subunit protein snf7 [Savitreella phatthalungensis]
MWGLFGGGSKAKADDPKAAIVSLQSNLTFLEKRQAHLTKQAEEQEAEAKKNMHNKRAAMAALRRKKQYENEVDKLEDHKRTVEQQLFMIQNANIQHETVQAMKQGAAAMKAINKGMNIEKVDKTMDEIRDQMDVSNEISEALSSTRLGYPQEDEDELTAELERMQQEELEKKLLDGGRVPANELPGQPVPAARLQTGMQKSATKTAEEEAEEEEFAKLQAEFAM